MMLVYNIAISMYAFVARVVSLWSPKARLWCEGRRDLLDRMESEIDSSDSIVWVHVASLGEFEQGRPIIEKIRADHPEYKILITFFSPSGYEIRRNYEGADYIYYMPIDTPRNVKRFMDIVNPKIAIFIKYEYWLNYLYELRDRKIKSYIVSAIFRPNSIFFRAWGMAWREALEAFEILFVQDKNSKMLLAEWGFDNVVIAGDTRFDRVWEITKKSKSLPIIKNFVLGEDMMVVGSSWEADEEIIIPLINKNPKVKFVIAPHEIDKRRIDYLIARLGGRGVLYSKCNEFSYFGNEQILIVDTMGLLSSIYKYAKWGYIGGGFGRGIHNTLEAVTFGLPIAFGSKYTKFKEACDLVSLGVATSVTSFDELNEWFSKLQEQETREVLNTKAKDFVSRRRGATTLITKTIFK